MRRALRRGEINAEDAKEGMRFGAARGACGEPRQRAGGRPAVGTRAHIGWFGITVASFERGDIRQSPNGIFVYGDEGGARFRSTAAAAPACWR